MDRSAVAKAKTNRKQRTVTDKRDKREVSRKSGAVSGASRKATAAALPRPANDTDVRASQVSADADPDETMSESMATMTPEGIPEGIDEAALAAVPELEEDLEVTVVTGEEDDVVQAAAAAEEADEEEAEEKDSEEDKDASQERDGEEAESKSGEEPQSFLAMYFRDMAELEVLRPEQEFETARHIEQLELELWRMLLGHPPAAGWVADLIDKAVEQPVPDLKGYRVAADKAKGKLSLGGRARFDKLVTELAATLKEMDIDRIFVEAVMTEVRRVAKAARGEPHLDALPGFAGTKTFDLYARAAADKMREVKFSKNAFVKANLRLVVSIARRFNHGRLPLPDLIQEGNIGLMKAVERYDYRRGFRFSTYASWWIRHAISRALADKGRAVRLPVHMIDAYHKIAKSERELQSKLERPATIEEIATATGIETDKLEKMKTFLAETPVSLDKPISDEDGRRLIDVLVDPNEAPAPPEQMMNSETQREMLKLLGGLKPIEADILRKRFGLVNDRERTLKEIGDEYHLSRERVRQLQEQALGKMRRAMSKLD
jgi:RNA polymerase primary sigma factor